MARTLVASDNFDRADGPVGANWLYIRLRTWTASTPEIVGNKLQGKASGGNYQAIRWQGAGAFIEDQYAKGTIGNLSNAGAPYRAGVILRGSTDIDTAADYYSFYLLDDGASTRTTKLAKRVNGAVTELDSRTSAWANGDTIALEISGPVLRAYKNDVLMFEYTDATPLTGGNPGILIGSASTTICVDNWEGGNVETDAIAPTMSGSITFSNVTSSGFTSSWPVAADNTGVAGYEVSVSTTATDSYVNVGNVLTTTETGKAANTTYNVKVGAYDASGNRSQPITATVTTAVPTGITLVGANCDQHATSGTGAVTVGEGATLTSLPMKSWFTGLVRANETNLTILVYDKAGGDTGALLIKKTGQSSNASGVWSSKEPGVVAGRTYRLIYRFADGAEGMETVIAV